jgi:hypothetical protein
MKKAIIVGISLSLLILLSPVKNDISQTVSVNDSNTSSNSNLAHPILPPVG